MRRIGFKSSENRRAEADLLAGEGAAHTRRLLLLLGSLTVVLVAGASLAAAGAFTPPAPPRPAPVPSPPAPAIVARPADPTNQSSAHFAYTDAQNGVSYECQLDGASFSSCPAAGVTYAGRLSDGSHSFKVRALSGARRAPAALSTGPSTRSPRRPPSPTPPTDSRSAAATGEPAARRMPRSAAPRGTRTA